MSVPNSFNTTKTYFGKGRSQNVTRSRTPGLFSGFLLLTSVVVVVVVVVVALLLKLLLTRE